MSEQTVWIVVVALVVVGAGGLVFSRTGGSSDERAVEATVVRFLGAIGHDGEEACLQLSREAQAELKRHEDSNSCERAAESVGQPEAVYLFDFNEIRFGPENESARVPSQFDDVLEGVSTESVGVKGVFPPIPLEEGDGRWRITSLDWYFKSWL
jgi:hypothetical protein